MTDIENAKKEYDQLLKELSEPELVSNTEKFQELSRRQKALEKIIEKIKEKDEVKKQQEENKAIIRAREDAELITLAEAEIPHLQEREKALEKEISDLMKGGNESGSVYNCAILEIRAGTGGHEASLFAGDLYRMYTKYALSQGWRQKILDSHADEIGGYKEIIFEISGQGCYEKLKFEGGVHRVQRIPETEKAGRIHTSTATVAVLAKPKSTEYKIKADELKIDVYKSSGPGGQNVNKRETAVRITHLPTGIVVASQNERSLPQNKENAMSILAAKLLEKKTEEDHAKMAGKRKIQIGGAKRSEKIRTYNFPHDRITDHRVGKSWHNLEEIMEGKIEKIIERMAESLAGV